MRVAGRYWSWAVWGWQLVYPMIGNQQLVVLEKKFSLLAVGLLSTLELLFGKQASPDSLQPQQQDTE